MVSFFFQLKYDIVVSAFSLFELPHLRARLETVLSLWNKTQGYLVLVENGTNAGFQVMRHQNSAFRAITHLVLKSHYVTALGSPSFISTIFHFLKKIFTC